ncbi:MAG: hypothetical protein V7L14_27830 [Nostoc sp.]|uniref:hypothetical protein n=1 Tax=unclassified Nostoc TaxID=2593658 RepID=UPI0025EAE048|nr:hypothetical protein [Nostoc sp. NOS(2021)]MBN3899050.1 hypothetical protein [Nostoc sp. NOS(2021)]
MKNIVKSLLDERTKSTIRSSELYQALYNRMHSSKLAVAGKRLDICANEIAIYLLQAGKEKYVLRDKICLEIGSGWLLTHSLVFYLLGAKKVYATDVYPLLQPENILKAVCKSVDWSILDSLSTFEDREIIHLRLKKLLSLRNLSVEVLRDLGIEYIAPIDLSQKLPSKERIDFIFSKSVLEHVPVDDVVPLLENLVSSLSEDGFMFHLIHLLDHKNLNERPFDFFVYPQEAYSRELQSRWGNRIRRSQWKQIFSNLKHLDSKFVFEWSCKDAELPEKIDSSIEYTDEEDLRISHIGVVGEFT